MRRCVCQILLCLGSLTGVTSVATAQDAVPKLIRIVVPFSPGASNDAIARMLATPLASRFDTTLVVENRPGAAGVIGAELVAKSPRDGSVVLLTSSTFLTAAATRSVMPYDPVSSFAPVGLVAQNPSILAISAALPFKSPAVLLAAARANPDELTYKPAR